MLVVLSDESFKLVLASPRSRASPKASRIACVARRLPPKDQGVSEIRGTFKWDPFRVPQGSYKGSIQGLGFRVLGVPKN